MPAASRCLIVLLSALAIAAEATPASSAPAPQSFIHTTWTTANGLPQSTVSAILQTRDGYLWLGTFGGLVRFDGVAFAVFTVGNTPRLKSNRVLGLHESRDGTLWIATELGGVARIKNGEFLPPLTTAEGLPSDRVWSVTDTPDGDTWLATAAGVARIHDGGVVHVYSSRNGLATTDDESNAVLGEPDGSLWIGNNAGLFVLRNGSIATISAGSVPSVHIHSLCRTPDGTLWVGTHAGLARVKDGALVTVDATLGHVVYLSSDSQGDLWAATNHGLVNVHRGVVTRYSDVNDPSDENLLAVAIDREGNLWIGGMVGGLSRWRPRPVTFITQQDGLAGASVLPIFEDREKRLWAGAMCGGLSRLSGGTWISYGKKEGLEDLCVQAIEQDRSGTLWLGTAGGLTRFAQGQFTRVNESLGFPSIVRVRALHVDGAGTLWVGSSSGLSRMEGDRLRTFTVRDGLVNDDVRFIADGRDGALWIGTVGGASRLGEGRFTNYTTRNGLSHDFVRAVREDADGTIWLGTYGGGLNRLKDGRMSSITTRQGLFDDVVSAILEDDDGNFWMSGNRGVFRASRAELNAVADGKAPAVMSVGYGTADGMTVSETNGGAQPAGCRTSDGRLWFPTIGGIAVFDPRRMTKGTPPLVVIEQVMVDGAAIPASSGSIDVPAGTRSLEIRYTGLSLGAPERTRFRYALEGYDPGLVDAGTRRVAYYTSLPPRRYRFHVIAANAEGVWNETGVSIPVRWRPRFYQTWIFDVLAVLAAVGLAGGGYRLRLGHLTRRTRELERHVSARTAEVVERSNELAQANAQLETANSVIAAARDDMLATLNQLRLGVAVVETSGKVAFLNDQARRFLGIDPDQHVEQPWDELLPLSPRDRAQLQTAALLPASRRARLPVRVETSSRRAYWMEIDVHDDPRDPERRILCLYDLSEVYDLRRLLDDKAQFHGLVGQSAAMQLVFKQIRDVATVDTTVLIEGETGTGKELVARAIHYSSPRKLRAFVPVNSAGLTESLLASQLFGHRRGAFTGAVADQVGLFESGEGGTVFLDEIGDVPLAIQASLLRVLQEKEITRVGEHRPHKIDVRIVAATHRDLAQEVAEARFRGDLLYRIRVARIQLPPLRARKEDIPLLVAWFLGHARAAARRDNLELSHEAMDLLLEYSWPGNVRELKSAIDSAAIRATGTLIQASDLPPEVLADGGEVAESGPVSPDVRLDVLGALARAKGNRAAAARLLGIGRSTLYRRLRAMGVDDD
jgi:DNA-binding NtrC family response regulator/ligand-binding sensor domain-containing protein